MNSVIDQKLFNLITKVENFEFAYDISKRFRTIEHKLVNDFWNEFQNKISLEHKDFIIKQTDEWEFIFYSKNWKMFKYYANLFAGRLEIGVGIDDINYNNLFEKLNTELMFFLPTFENELSKFEFWYYLEINDDFNSIEVLKNILPANRKKTINGYYDEINDMIKRTLSIINSYERKASKNN